MLPFQNVVTLVSSLRLKDSRFHVNGEVEQQAIFNPLARCHPHPRAAAANKPTIMYGRNTCTVNFTIATTTGPRHANDLVLNFGGASLQIKQTNRKADRRQIVQEIDKFTRLFERTTLNARFSWMSICAPVGCTVDCLRKNKIRPAAVTRSRVRQRQILVIVTQVEIRHNTNFICRHRRIPRVGGRTRRKQRCVRRFCLPVYHFVWAVQAGPTKSRRSRQVHV